MPTKSERLSHVEEIELIRLVRQGGTVGEYAANRLVTHNVGLVHISWFISFPSRTPPVLMMILYPRGCDGTDARYS